MNSRTTLETPGRSQDCFQSKMKICKALRLKIPVDIRMWSCRSRQMLRKSKRLKFPQEIWRRYTAEVSRERAWTNLHQGGLASPKRGSSLSLPDGSHHGGGVAEGVLRLPLLLHRPSPVARDGDASARRRPDVLRFPSALEPIHRLLLPNFAEFQQVQSAEVSYCLREI